jgi:3-oxoacyl-[acyl-carrier protein] reductase
VDTLGPVDILVNNANIYFPIKAFLEYTWEDFESKILQEMKAAFHPCKAVASGMARRRSGCIINVSSGLSRQPGLGFSAHTSAKSALDGFSKALAQELGPHGIRVNVVAPGLTLTDATAGQPKEMLDGIAQHTPLRRVQGNSGPSCALLRCAGFRLCGVTPRERGDTDGFVFRRTASPSPAVSHGTD